MQDALKAKEIIFILKFILLEDPTVSLLVVQSENMMKIFEP